MKTINDNTRLHGMMNGFTAAVISAIASIAIIMIHGDIGSFMTLFLACLQLPAAFAAALLIGRREYGENEETKGYVDGLKVSIIPMAIPTVVFIWWAMIEYFGGWYFMLDTLLNLVYPLTMAAAVAVNMIMMYRKYDGLQRRSFYDSFKIGAAVLAGAITLVAITVEMDDFGHVAAEFVLALIGAALTGIVAVMVYCRVMMDRLSGRPAKYDGVRVMLAANGNVRFEGRTVANANKAVEKGYMFLTDDALHIIDGNDDEHINDRIVKLEDVKAVGKLSRTRIAVCTHDGGSEFIGVLDAEEWVRMINCAAVQANGGNELADFGNMFAVRNRVDAD